MEHRLPLTPRLTASLAAGCLVLALAGCNATPKEYRIHSQGSLTDEVSAEAPQPGDAAVGAADTTVGAQGQDVFPVDGMVGQINGQPIYADSVFAGDDPIGPSLAALGRRRSRPAFRVDAAEMIEARLRAMALDMILLAEAERDLNDNERLALRRAVEIRREELIRQYGQGSIAVAHQQIKERTGRSFDDALEDYRRAVIIRRYISQLIEPKVNVTRRDIERDYREHLEEYRPPAKRTMRLIRVPTAEAASGITRRLDAGEPFEQIARDKANVYMASSGGVISGTGDRPLTPLLDPLNDRIKDMAAGDWAGPIEIAGTERLDGQWFVMVESIDAPPQLSLLDVQLHIENKLKASQRQAHTALLYERLRQGISTPQIKMMTQALVEIAVSRYAVIDDAGTLSPDS